MADLDLAELRRKAQRHSRGMARGTAYWPAVVLRLLDRLESAEAAEKQAHAAARLRAGAHQMAGERFDGVCMAVFAKAAEGGSLADVVDLVADWMQECDCVDEESEAAYERARAVAVPGAVAELIDPVSTVERALAERWDRERLMNNSDPEVDALTALGALHAAGWRIVHSSTERVVDEWTPDADRG